MLLTGVTIAGVALLVGAVDKVFHEKKADYEKAYREKKVEYKKAYREKKTYYEKAYREKKTYYDNMDQDEDPVLSLIVKMKQTMQKVQEQTSSLLTPEPRDEQLEEGSLEDASTTNEMWTRYFRVASGNLLIAGTSILYPPLVLATIPGLIYTHIPVYELAYQSIKERRVSSYILDVILVTGLFIGGYLVTAALGIWVVILGRMLLHKSESNSKKNLMNLFEKQSRYAWVLVGDIEIETPLEALKAGDIAVIGAGQAIPVDGVILDGWGSVDQHILTGESQPVEKGIGDSVFASTVVLTGKIYVKAEKTGQETVAMQISEILSQTADFKSQVQSRGERIADQLVLPTLGISCVIFPFLGFNGTLATLTNTFGYKMRLFGPASMLTFLNVTLQQGILIKDGRSLDLLKDIDVVVFDKTGTLTLEQPTVGQIHACANANEDEILMYAAAAEHGQTHPIAKAILFAANECNLHYPKFDNARYEIGYGIQVNLSDRVIRVGSRRFMAMEGISIPPEIDALQETCHKQGISLIMIAFDEQLVGAIELHATLRPEAKRVIQTLRQRNMSINIISGDHEQPTKKLAEELGVDRYFANTLPEKKASIITELQKEGKSVCFVGDGINDAIALKKANVSVSLRGATTMATDAAQIVLMDGNLNQLARLFDIAQDFDVNMNNNFLISTVPTVVCISGILFLHWGVVTGIMITGGTMLVGLGNTMLPLIKSEDTTNKID